MQEIIQSNLFDLNVQLEACLIQLQELDKERDEILKKRFKTKREQEKAMQESVEKYKALLKKIKKIKRLSLLLKQTTQN